MAVALIDLSTHFSSKLDAKRARWLLNELRHEKRVRPSIRGIQARTEPGCVIVVSDRGRTRRYQLFDRTVILEEATGRSWQFYFGMVVTEWLDWAQSPPALYEPEIRLI